MSDPSDPLRDWQSRLTEEDPVTLITNLLSDPVYGVKEARIQAGINVGISYAFIHINSGYTGRAHYICREGDEVYLLAGADMPVVLRRCGQDDTFRMVAPVYIIGAMRGELWPDDDKELDTITLV